jgi:hypothetical protein
VASKSLVEWLKMLWENKRVSAQRALGLYESTVLFPLRLGGSSPFYRSRGRRTTCMPRYLATWRSTTCYAVEWAAVRAILAAIWSSWLDLYPNSGGSRVGEQRMAVMSFDRLEGGADAGPYGVQELAERRSFPTRFTGLESLL